MTIARRALRALAVPLALGLATAVIAACETGAYPADIFPEMHYQQSYRAQEPPFEAPPEGQVSTRGSNVVVTDFLQAINLDNPVPFDGVSIDRGRALYGVNCAMCHGADGQSQTLVADRFELFEAKRPASLVSENVKGQPDGALYWTITNGVGNMPAWQRLVSAGCFSPRHG
jgi:mono/diheme cytochrome c family protein